MRLAWVVYDALYKLLSKVAQIYFISSLCYAFRLPCLGYLELSPPDEISTAQHPEVLDSTLC